MMIGFEGKCVGSIGWERFRAMVDNHSGGEFNAASGRSCLHLRNRFLSVIASSFLVFLLVSCSSSGTAVLQTLDEVVQAEPTLDSDGDRIVDRRDAFPLDASEFADTDDDGTGDRRDDDDDGDGVTDVDDCAPLSAAHSVVDVCGICGGDGESCKDCNGDPNGVATRDDCGICAGGNTGVVPDADKDCAGVCGGAAVRRGYCRDNDGDGRGHGQQQWLCDDEVGIGNANGGPNWVRDCSDFDDSCASNIHDCAGVCDGPAMRRSFCVDADFDGLGAGVPRVFCDAQAPVGWKPNCGDTDDHCPSNSFDCSGVCDGSSQVRGFCYDGNGNGIGGINLVNKCDGLASDRWLTNCGDAADTCGLGIMDCAGVCDGTAALLDYFEDQDGDGLGAGVAVQYCSALVPDGWTLNGNDADDNCHGLGKVTDCHGVCDGGAVFDLCDVCGGDGTSCLPDCDESEQFLKLPVSVDFEEMERLGPCWQHGDDGGFDLLAELSPPSGVTALGHAADGGIGDDAVSGWIKTPWIDLEPWGNRADGFINVPELSFWYTTGRAPIGDGDAVASLVVEARRFDDTEWDELMTLDPSDEWKYRFINLGPFSPARVTIRFRYQGPGVNSFSVDDLNILPATHECSNTPDLRVLFDEAPTIFNATIGAMLPSDREDSCVHSQEEPTEATGECVAEAALETLSDPNGEYGLSVPCASCFAEAGGRIIVQCRTLCRTAAPAACWDCRIAQGFNLEFNECSGILFPRHGVPGG